MLVLWVILDNAVTLAYSAGLIAEGWRTLDRRVASTAAVIATVAQVVDQDILNGLCRLVDLDTPATHHHIDQGVVAELRLADDLRELQPE